LVAATNWQRDADVAAASTRWEVYQLRDDVHWFENRRSRW
jgi:hypothetical protein